MGHRAYLIIRTGAGTSELFEANNFPPFCWVTLLDQEVRAPAALAWGSSHHGRLDPQAQESYGDLSPCPPDLVIEKPALSREPLASSGWLVAFPW